MQAGAAEAGAGRPAGARAPRRSVCLPGPARGAAAPATVATSGACGRPGDAGDRRLVARTAGGHHPLLQPARRAAAAPVCGAGGAEGRPRRRPQDCRAAGSRRTYRGAGPPRAVQRRGGARSGAPHGRRTPGDGKKTPHITATIRRLIADDTGGHPTRAFKWCRTTPAKIAAALGTVGIQVGASTVRRLLTGLMGYSLRVNHKKIESGHRNPPKPKVRDAQFHYISDLRQWYRRQGWPSISVDTKKKELVGNFKNNGRAWKSAPVAVYDHDFPSDAQGKMVPYGVYDPEANRAFVNLGTSGDTPAFAVDSIAHWWQAYGQAHYPQAADLLILADSGGANSSHSRVWKYRLKKQLCDAHGLTVTVCHYPPGASKWNPIEHRLFSEITKRWAGEPLVSQDRTLHFIRTTTTQTGLRVTARLDRSTYATGETVSQVDMDAVTLALSPHDTLPDWNYTLHPWPTAEM
ncbi:MAG: ISAzo13 family transposase [Planctomycetes bacterium]|nr:ISAzo13 family transposase [Planctomycetota bacterium]